MTVQRKGGRQLTGHHGLPRAGRTNAENEILAPKPARNGIKDGKARADCCIHRDLKL